ncbi:MAG TPA: hypothetical protein VM925_08420 [Labilithrix sp.]|nr:hypothetical protein [Labilithrix sp.]
MVAKPAPTDPVLAAVENAPIAAESEEERAAVLAAMAESKAGLAAAPHEEVMRRFAAQR